MKRPAAGTVKEALRALCASRRDWDPQGNRIRLLARDTIPGLTRELDECQVALKEGAVPAPIELEVLLEWPGAQCLRCGTVVDTGERGSRCRRCGSADVRVLRPEEVVIQIDE